MNSNYTTTPRNDDSEYARILTTPTQPIDVVKAPAVKRGRGRPASGLSEEEKKQNKLEASRAFRAKILVEDPNYFKKYTKKCPVHVCNGITNECLICHRNVTDTFILWDNINNRDPTPNSIYHNFVYKITNVIVMNIVCLEYRYVT